MELSVIACGNCPFAFFEEENEWICVVSGKELNENPYDSDRAPDFCPLYDSDIVVKLRNRFVN